MYNTYTFTCTYYNKKSDGYSHPCHLGYTYRQNRYINLNNGYTHL